MVDEKTTKMSSVLGETSVVVGNVNGSGDLEIRGRVQGSVTIDGRVLISETGVVLGGVEATHVAVAGEIRGDLTARDGVEVQAQGRVEGNIEAPRVGIEAGARVRGMLRTGGDLPTSGTDEPAPSVAPAVVPKQPKKARMRPKKGERREQHGGQRPRGPAPKEGASPLARLPEGQRDVSTTPASSHEDGPAPTTRPEKRSHRKGPPPPPTFVKGARGRAK